MAELQTFLQQHARDGLLPTMAELDAVSRFAVSCAKVEEAALEIGLFPARLQRNRSTISTEGQLALLRSRVAVIGCGGLGGYVIEELARLGVGGIVAIDPDVFEEHNLNRQLLSTIGNLGQPKVNAAEKRVQAVNPAVTVTALQQAFSRENGAELLSGATVVVDTLDNVATRLELIAVCREVGVPLVHGAIAGWYGQVATQLPGADISPFLAAATQEKGIETRLGNPSFTPAVVASLQVAETCKIILGEGTPLAERMLMVNLLDQEMEEVRL